jgi:carbon-monoxide dehydrogenase large subunit
MPQVNGKREGVGASVLRLEDDRYLRGRGRFIADIKLPGMLDVAFVRSPLAHARIRGIGKPTGHETSVFVADDLVGITGIRANSGLPGFRSSVQPILAHDKVRYVGEPLAACLGETRAAAEDIADRVALDLAELPAVVEMTHARDRGASLVHEHWPENVFLETSVNVNFEAAAKDAAVVVKRTFRTARQSMAPMEGRGVVAYWDNQAQQIVVYSAAQMPHIVRTGLAECLGLDQG